MQYFSRGSDKYTEIKMCDLEPFSKIRSHIMFNYIIIMYIGNGILWAHSVYIEIC